MPCPAGGSTLKLTTCGVSELTLPPTLSDGVWRTLDSRRLLGEWKLTLGYAYQSALRASAKELGQEGLPGRPAEENLSQLGGDMFGAEKTIGHRLKQVTCFLEGGFALVDNDPGPADGVRRNLGFVRLVDADGVDMGTFADIAVGEYRSG